MEITFKNYSQDSKTTYELTIIPDKPNVLISLHTHTIDSIVKDSEAHIWLNKKELSDFIGSLLHIQSKMR
jgi:hypothetical protein